MVAMMDLSLANVKRLKIDLDEVIFESQISVQWYANQLDLSG